MFFRELSRHCIRMKTLSRLILVLLLVVSLANTCVSVKLDDDVSDTGAANSITTSKSVPGFESRTMPGSLSSQSNATVPTFINELDSTTNVNIEPNYTTPIMGTIEQNIPSDTSSTMAMNNQLYSKTVMFSSAEFNTTSSILRVENDGVDTNGNNTTAGLNQNESATQTPEDDGRRSKILAGYVTVPVLLVSSATSCRSS